MSKSEPTRKQLSGSLRAQALVVAELMEQLKAAMGDPAESKRWLNMGLDRITGILPSERDSLRQARASIEIVGDFDAITRAIETLLAIAVMAAVRLIPADSSNSDSPPGKEIGPKGKKPKGSREGGRKPGGQKGHPGRTMPQFENPDVVCRLVVDRSKLPPGEWRLSHYIRRQVASMEMRLFITEYLAEVLTNEKGETFQAQMPPESAGRGDDCQTSGLIPVEEFDPNVQPARNVKTLIAKPESVSSPDGPEDRAEAETEPVAVADSEVEAEPVAAKDSEPVAGADSKADSEPVAVAEPVAAKDSELVAVAEPALRNSAYSRMKMISNVAGTISRSRALALSIISYWPVKE